MTRFTPPRDACESSRFRTPERPAYGHHKRTEGNQYVPTTGGQGPRKTRKPVAHPAYVVNRRPADSSRGEPEARMRPETPQRETQRPQPRLKNRVHEGPRGSILLIPGTLSTLPLEGVAEALRSHSRRSQRVLEVYSPSILRLVRRLVFPHILRATTMSSWSLVWSNILLELLLVTFIVTLWIRSSCRVGL